MVSTSQQDAIINGMTLDEVRAWRLNAAKEAIEAGNYASTHNKYIKDTIKDLETGIRLTDANLEALVKKAKKSAGISAKDLLDFTLGNTEKNRELMQTMDARALKAYIANIKKASNKFVGGITPQDVINNSSFVDIKRSNTQIFLAADFKREGDTISFITNSGPGSKDAHHYVTVRLLDYQKGLVDARVKGPSFKEVGDLVKAGRIRFDCDCGRHRYWYRYLATIGKYNHGIDETRYPNTRNPNLTGLACKHVLRVMNHLTSGSMLSKIQKNARDDIAKAQNQSKKHRNTRQQVERDALTQTEALNNWNGRLHWAKKIQKEVAKAQKKIEQEIAQEARRNPNKPPQALRAGYSYAKKQINKPGVPDEFKSIYKKTIDDFESKWGAAWR